jgi:hypothetical protein
MLAVTLLYIRASIFFMKLPNRFLSCLNTKVPSLNWHQLMAVFGVTRHTTKLCDLLDLWLQYYYFMMLLGTFFGVRYDRTMVICNTCMKLRLAWKYGKLTRQKLQRNPPFCIFSEFSLEDAEFSPLCVHFIIGQQGGCICLYWLHFYALACVISVTCFLFLYFCLL